MLIFPQLSKSDSAEKWKIDAEIQLTKVGRTWKEDEISFGPIGERRHRYAAYEIAGITSKEDRSKTSEKVHDLSAQGNRAAVLLYPIYSLGEDGKSSSDKANGIDPLFPPIGMEYFLPINSMPVARFEPIRRDMPEELVVDRPQ